MSKLDASCALDPELHFGGKQAQHGQAIWTRCDAQWRVKAFCDSTLSAHRDLVHADGLPGISDMAEKDYLMDERSSKAVC